MRLLAVAFLLVFTTVVTADPFADNWHQWRGPEANGVSRTANPPLEWSENENVQWKVPIEGQGGSSPIVWEDKIFLLTAIDTGKIDPSKTAPEDQTHENPFGIKYPNTVHQYVVICLERATGKVIWRKIAREQVPVEGHHPDNDFASSSPTTDGQRLYVWFGSAGLYCYSLDGELLWQRDLGPGQTRLSFGEASSPVIHDERLIVTRDLDSPSSITVFDAKTGETIWQKERDEPSCWATPIIVEHDGIEQLVTNAHNRVRSYNLANGDLIWECGGQVSNVTPSPLTDGDAVYCMSGYRGSAAMALPLDATGDITGSNQIRWSISRGTPYVPSPILYDGLLYFNQTNDAILTCLDAKTGEALIARTRLPGIRGVYASPVGAADRVYYVGRDGVTLVLDKAPELKILATNKLAEPMDATPALVGNQIFLRSESSLYCVGVTE